MNRGKWIILAVVAVALLMALSTWPLLKVRRKNELRKTEALLSGLLGSCETYRTQYGRYPASLSMMFGGDRIIPDAWQRPIIYELIEDSLRIRSLGPNPDNPSDDLEVSNKR